jgi:polyhydroxybutyrate depolymerase
MKINRIAGYVVTLFFCSCASSLVFSQSTAKAGITENKITVDGIGRTYLVYQPRNYSPDKKAPLLFLFHGGGANARSMLNISVRSDFTDISEREGILLVAPQGVRKSWNDGRNTKANQDDVDDIKFVQQLLDRIKSTYSIDSSRVYATGISNGGFMVSRIGCEIGNKFAAIAAVAATMGKDNPYLTCQPGFQLPVMYIHGSADPIIPIDGAKKSIGAEGEFVSHEAVVEKWVAIDHCATKPVVTNLPKKTNDNTSITRSEYSNDKGINVVSYVVNNGGHTWPGGKQYLPRIVIGNLSREMNACEVIWDFFKNHRR